MLVGLEGFIRCMELTWFTGFRAQKICMFFLFSDWLRFTSSREQAQAMIHPRLCQGSVVDTCQRLVLTVFCLLGFHTAHVGFTAGASRSH